MRRPRILAAIVLVFCMVAEAWSAGQATGKRTHKPLAARTYYDQAFLNTDGNGTFTLVESETGAYSVATETSPDTLIWSAPRASGVGKVSGVTLGNVLDLNRPALVVTSPEANRVNVLALDSAASLSPLAVHVPSLGPDGVVAIDVGGTGNTGHDDLFVASRWNGTGAGANRYTTVRAAGGGSLTVLQDRPAAGPMFNPKEFTIDVGHAWSALGVVHSGAADTFVAYRFDSGSRVEVFTVPGLPPGTDWAWGRFSAAPLAQLLFFQVGGTNLESSAIEAGAVPGSYLVGPRAVCLEVPAGIQDLTVVRDSLGTRLLVVDAGGEQATLHRFAGAGIASLLESLVPPPGEVFVAALPLPTDGFVMITAGTGAGETEDGTRHHVYRPQVAGANVTYQRVASGAVPQLGLNSGTANVFQYQREPFVHPAPNLLRSLHAGDWTSSFGLAGGPPAVSVQAETFVDAFRGLDDPTPIALGAPHPQTQFGGVNQYAEFISLGTFTPAVGDEVSDVTIQPPPGLYERSVQVTLSAADPAHQIFYRINESGSWVQFAGTPVTLFANATVHYYGRPALGTAKSPVKTARYRFTSPPGEADSDRDGVPDFVESAEGLNPAGGADSDGDGFSDKQELLEGRSPADPLSHPPGQPGFEQHAAFDLVVTPRPLDGVTGVETTAAPGTLLRLYDLSGGLIGAAVVANPPDSPTPASAVFRSIPIDAQNSLLVVATEPHFDVETPGSDRRLGREMVGLVEVPAVPAVVVNYTYGSAGGVPAAEAAAWIAAAQAAQMAQDRPVEQVAFYYNKISWAVLFEHSLLQYLAQRGYPDGTNGTLLSFRAFDTGRWPLSPATLSGAEQPDPAHPELSIVKRTDRASVIAARLDLPQARPFLDLTRLIYEISSRSNNVAPGAYSRPLDYLRSFVAEGPSLTHELTHVVQQTDAALPANAFAAVNFILSGVNPRPVTNLTLRFVPDSFSGTCTTLETTGLPPTLVRLVGPDGLAYPWPDAFAPLPGTELEIVGYTDVLHPGCPGPALEVIQARVVSLPSALEADLNGNLLPDAWEKFFFVSTLADPFEDGDGDGYSNLQELYEGSDPKDGFAFPAVPAANLAPPTVQIEIQPGGPLQLEWFWPAAYASRVQFSIQGSTSLSQPFAPVPVTPVHLGDGRFRVVLPGPATGGTSQQYYHVALCDHQGFCR